MTKHDRHGERADDLLSEAPSLDPDKTRHDLTAQPRHIAGGVDTPEGTESDQDVEGRAGP